jgi:hypothetical protein
MRSSSLPRRTDRNNRDETKIYAMVVDRSGNVLWRATGPYDEANGKSLQEFLEKPAAHPTTVPTSPAN